jgi:translation initiation factor 2B subunit (eIF-2B alpha/beta/delta family)
VFTRYLSLGLGGALVAFAIYHWLLVRDLTSELRAKEAQLAHETQRLASLQAGQAALSKSVAEYKSQVEDQANQLRLLQLVQNDGEKRLQQAMAEAEHRAAECAKRPPTIQIIKQADAKCAALKRALDQYIAQRQRQLGAAPVQSR